MKTSHWISAALTVATLAAPIEAAQGAGFKDLLDSPATQTARANKALLNGLARAGSRLVAVGQRGHIVYSDDAGQHWQQAQVPVSSDLTAVAFPSPQRGWAVGHDGVVLNSADGGKTWAKQFDGKQAGQVMASFYADAVARGLGGSAEAAARLADDAKRFAEQGPDKPFLDVWFENERSGYIVGAFNLVFHTNDGGQHWEPWYDRTDNPKQLHLYGIRQAGGELYIVGEQGLVMKLDRAAGRFLAIQTPYNGTFFGVTGKDNTVIAYGLRGNAYRSVDGGANWSKIPIGLPLGLTASTMTQDGKLVLVTQAGHVLVSVDDGATFQPIKVEKPLPAAAVLAADQGSVLVAGPRGAALVPLKK